MLRYGLWISNCNSTDTPGRFLLPRLLLYTDRLSQQIQTWIEQLRAGDIRALSRAISTVENRKPGWTELLKALFPHSGKERVLGLTGPPGAGKSPAWGVVAPPLPQRELHGRHYRSRPGQPLRRRRDSWRPHPYAG